MHDGFPVGCPSLIAVRSAASSLRRAHSVRGRSTAVSSLSFGVPIIECHSRFRLSYSRKAFQVALGTEKVSAAGGRLSRAGAERREPRRGAHRLHYATSDGLLAVFGHPVAHDDDVRRAERPVLRCREVDRHRDQAKRRFGIRINVRVGCIAGQSMDPPRRRVQVGGQPGCPGLVHGSTGRSRGVRCGGDC